MLVAAACSPSKRSPMLLCWIVLGMWLGGCANEESSAGSMSLPTGSSADTLGTRTVYAYAPTPDADDRYLIAEAQPGWLGPELTVEAALDSLGRALSRGYFYDVYDSGEPTGIAFEIVDVLMLPTPPDSMRIAVVDMVDPEGVAMRHFFQGTTGSAITQNMIAAAFTQAPLTPDDAPLLDGLILLYNGERMEETDHIRLHLIQQPTDVAVLPN